ncbi:hypothetical protein ACRRVD_01490 [Candidatus Cardinium hertigii]|uniref:hypothetical protein n=1 Tax=Candidatus Cardinium hertigii TaxID=247481 RepID=UPI003D7EA65E
MKDALTKQQLNSTKPTNIGLEQPSLLGNRLQNIPLPSKKTSTSLPISSLPLEKKDNPLPVDTLPLQGKPTIPEIGVVGRDYLNTIDSTDNIEPKKPNLLAKSKSEEACSNIPIKPSDTSNISNVDNNLNTVDNVNVKNLIERFEGNIQKELQENIDRTNRPFKIIGSTNMASNNLNATVPNKNIDEIYTKSKKIGKEREIDPLIDIQLLDNSAEKISDFVADMQLKWTRVLTMIDELEEELQKNPHERDTNFEVLLIKLRESELDSLKKDLLKKYLSISEEIDKISKVLNPSNTQTNDNPLITELIKIMSSWNEHNKAKPEYKFEKCKKLLEEITKDNYNSNGDIKNVVNNLQSLQNTIRSILKLTKQIICQLEENISQIEHPRDRSISNF